jgi:hypothetical protein
LIEKLSGPWPHGVFARHDRAGPLAAPFTPADVAILNQAELSQQIDPGRILKIPAAR